jgi:membrane fusion protein, adhesin transport system
VILNKEEMFSRARPLDVAKEGRMLWLMAITVLVFIIWANWAQLDEQVRASGKVIVSSRSQVVQAVDGGVLAAMYVKEGQIVQAGELLAELDQARFAARAEETRFKAIDLRANVERLRAELNRAPLEFSAEVMADPELVRRQTNLHHRRLEQQKEEQDSIRKSLKLAQEELNSLQELAKTGDASKSEVLNARRQVVDRQAELVNKENGYRKEAQEKLSATQSELEQTLEVLKQRDEALKATKIVAPMAGAVKNIEVSTIGAVLQGGEELMQIVPSDEPLIVEARVYSKDVAFVRPGLPANVKLDAYDFTVYGGLKGEVTYISPDTIDADLQRDEDPYYRVLIEITEVPEQEEGVDPIDIIPGMTTTTEIITGHKSVAQYIMMPLLRGSAAALTER